MDIDEGDVLWIGKGRAIADFSKFFEDIDMDYYHENLVGLQTLLKCYNSKEKPPISRRSVVDDQGQTL